MSWEEEMIDATRDTVFEDPEYRFLERWDTIKPGDQFWMQVGRRPGYWRAVVSSIGLFADSKKSFRRKRS